MDVKFVLSVSRSAFFHCYYKLQVLNIPVFIQYWPIIIYIFYAIYQQQQIILLRVLFLI